MQSSFDFGDFPALTTERLDLCECEDTDATDLFVVRGDPEVQLYNSAPHASVEETLRFIDDGRAAYRVKRELRWALRLRETGRAIGGISVFDWDRYHRRAQLGYDLARQHWGKGLMLEAMRAVIGFGFERMALNRLEIWTSSANERSLRLAERLGFTREGTLRKRILEDDGMFHDGTLWGLLRSERDSTDAPMPGS